MGGSILMLSTAAGEALTETLARCGSLLSELAGAAILDNPQVSEGTYIGTAHSMHPTRAHMPFTCLR